MGYSFKSDSLLARNPTEAQKLTGDFANLTEILDRPAWDDVIIRPNVPRRGLFVSCPALTPLRLPLCTFQKSTI